jgi:large subunit ribosomal protein L7/L12
MEKQEKLTKEQFFAHLDNLTVIELVDYIKEFETRYGISAAMAAPVIMAGGVVPQAEAKPAEEKTSFNVVLKNVGSQKIQVIKVVREVTNLGLKEAKDFVDSAPKVLKENVSKEEAEAIKAKFAEVGATIEIQ